MGTYTEGIGQKQDQNPPRQTSLVILHVASRTRGSEIFSTQGLDSPALLVLPFARHMGCLLDWLSLQSAAFLIRQFTLLASLNSWDLYSSFGFTFTASCITGAPAGTQTMIYFAWLPTAFEIQWKPPCPPNFSIMHSCRTNVM